MNDFRQYSFNQDKSPLRSNENRISLIAILRFLKDAYKTILVSGILGIAPSIAYLAITPKQHEESVQIVMAQIRATNNSNTIGVNIEKPVHLIARTSSPTSFTPGLIAACGLQGQVNASLLLSKSINLTITKEVLSVVELGAFGPTPQLVQGFTVALFELIKTTQSEIIAPILKRPKSSWPMMRITWLRPGI